MSEDEPDIYDPAFSRGLYWVCKNLNCPDTSRQQPGGKCKSCGGNIGGLPKPFLGRWANFKALAPRPPKNKPPRT